MVLIFVASFISRLIERCIAADSYRLLYCNNSIHQLLQQPAMSKAKGSVILFDNCDHEIELPISDCHPEGVYTQFSFANAPILDWRIDACGMTTSLLSFPLNPKNPPKSWF